ncbi:MAG: cell division protein ZapE [Legionellales bacterium]|nr:cell division protein ZapE [Legionellales bacterium]|tara:strand:+ start:6422 stop:7540 length:1119 start_codon:yes stop_codon:yes gene_type:complete
MLTPSQKYQQDLDSGELLPDPAQRDAVAHLQRVFDDYRASQQPNLFIRLKHAFSRKHRPLQGLYLWGGVGIGKTYLMDTFYECLPTERKMRRHFHRFMQETHEQLKQLKGQKDPLKIVAKQLGRKIDILCFDEFFVNDIGDAMILGNLLRYLLDEGVCFVATSNVVPDLLYEYGLQRELFLPAIKLLNTYTDVVHVNTDKDYRLRELQRAGVYYHPLGPETRAKMQQTFSRIAKGPIKVGETISIANRPIKTIQRSTHIIWFEFVDLCSTPRSQMDYLALAQRYQTIMVSNVPKITPQQDNVITYLINLVDVLYDANIVLILSAATPVPELYTEGRKVFEFQRTQSRLWEMQSFEYLQRSRELASQLRPFEQ